MPRPEVLRFSSSSQERPGRQARPRLFRLKISNRGLITLHAAYSAVQPKDRRRGLLYIIRRGASGGSPPRLLPVFQGPGLVPTQLDKRSAPLDSRPHRTICTSPSVQVWERPKATHAAQDSHCGTAEQTTNHKPNDVLLARSLPSSIPGSTQGFQGFNSGNTSSRLPVSARPCDATQVTSCIEWSCRLAANTTCPSNAGMARQSFAVNSPLPRSGSHF